MFFGLFGLTGGLGGYVGMIAWICLRFGLFRVALFGLEVVLDLVCVCRFVFGL